MKLYKKDFKEIARRINNSTSVENPAHVVKAELVHQLAGLFNMANPMFDKEKFVAACYQEYTE